MERRDPVERAAEDGTDLYEVATWEPRSVLDWIAVALYRAVYYGLHWIVILVALAITVLLLLTPGVLLLEEPLLGIFFGLSVVPALVLAGYIWYADVTTPEPLTLLVATFLLAVLFATFAALVNSVFEPAFAAIPLVGMGLFYFLIVGPVEETVKLLAVRVFAFRSDRFDAVIDGAVYGAIAGLGFAAIENAIYIARVVADVDAGLYVAATGIATLRALVGPGHVLYSAIAGYYLGLAKFNPDRAGPLVAKGLLVAAVFHAGYNTSVQVVPALIVALFPVPEEVAVVAYIVGYNLLVAGYLFVKLSRYRRTYRTVRDDHGLDPAPELDEFDPPRQ